MYEDEFLWAAEKQRFNCRNDVFVLLRQTRLHKIANEDSDPADACFDVFDLSQELPDILWRIVGLHKRFDDLPTVLEDDVGQADDRESVRDSGEDLRGSHET